MFGRHLVDGDSAVFRFFRVNDDNNSKEKVEYKRKCYRKC